MSEAAVRPGEAVLVLHGLLMNRHAMAVLAARLRRAGFTVQAFSYNSLRDGIESHVAATLRRFDGLNFGRVHLVGHSMGGVVALKAVERMRDTQRRRLGRVVALGSPLSGREMALAAEHHPLGRWMLGKSTELWRQGYPLRIPEGVAVGAIAGTRRFGLGALLGGLRGPNDGVVRVEETRLPGLADHMVLPVTHSGMLVSGAVGRQCAAFLRHGRFQHERT